MSTALSAVMRTAARAPLTWLAAGGVALVVAGCAAAPPSAPRGAPSHPALPIYAGREAALFDDDIEARAIGYVLGSSQTGDDLLRDRTRLGDSVLRVRVVTVTSRRTDESASWRIGVHTLEKLAGGRPPPADFTLEVPATTRGTGLLEAFDARLVGVTLIAFVRSFAGDGGGDQLHFHLTRASDDELRAVRTASLLGEVR